MPENNNERIITLDVAKGVTVTCVVLLHCVARFYFGESPNGIDGTLVRINALELAKEFLLPMVVALFFISGYVYKPGRTFKENAVRRAKQFIPKLVVCAVILNILLWIYLRMFGYDIPSTDLLWQMFVSIVGERTFQYHAAAISVPSLNFISAHYFIVQLLVAFLIFILLVEKTRHDLKKTIVAAILLSAVTALLIEILPVHLPHVCENCFFNAGLMLIGAYCRERNLTSFIDNEWKRPKYWFAFFSLTAIGLIGATFFPMRAIEFNHGVFGDYGGLSVFPDIILVLCTGYVCLTVFSFMAKIPGIRQLFTTIGRHSLAVIMLHLFFIKIIAVQFGYSIYGWVPVMDVQGGLIIGTLSLTLCILTDVAVTKAVGRLKENIRKRKDTGLGG